MNIEPIRKTVHLKATPEAIFDAFTVTKDLEAWFAHTATVDAVEGGSWRYSWPPNVAATGHFIKLDRPHELIWTWEESIEDDTVEPQPDSSHPVITNRYVIEAEGDGAVLHIEESGHASEANRKESLSGIEEMIVTLRAWVEQGERVDWEASTET